MRQAVSFFILLLICFDSLSSTHTVIGRVYEIIEEDEILKIQRRASQHDWSKVFDNPQEKVDSFIKREQNYLPYAPKDGLRLHVPHYVVEKQVIDKDGAVIYPVGFRYNPLNNVQLPFRVVVTDVNSLSWFKDKILKTDMILISSGNLSDAEKILGRTVFILNRRVKEKFNLSFVPSIVEQQNNLFRIYEYAQEKSDLKVSNEVN